MEEKNKQKMQNPQTVTKNPQILVVQKTNVWMIISIILLTALLVGVGVYFFLSSRMKSEQVSQKTQEQKGSQELVVQAEASPTTNTQPTKSTVAQPVTTSVDDLWNKYTNSDLGFSLKVLKNMREPYGQCAYSDKNGDHSYRPSESSVPVKIFEEGSTVYIASEYLYRLKGETKENSRTYYSGCERIANTPAIIKDRNNYFSPEWTIVIKSIIDDSQLDKFLKERYGEGCSLGEKKPSKQTGVFDIVIQGDGKDMGETKCLINYMTVVKYYPAKQKLAAWDIGQACNFYYPNIETCRDKEMTDSFMFE